MDETHEASENSLSEAESVLENVDEGYESSRKNDVEEDMRVA